MNIELSTKPKPKKIGKTTYFVSSFFKEQGRVTVVHKISRLIGAELEKDKRKPV